MDIHRVIEFPAHFGGNFHLQAPQIFLEITLAGEIADFHGVKVYELQPGDSHGSQLESNLPPNGAYADDGSFAGGQAVRGDQILLPAETFLNILGNGEGFTKWV